MFTDLTVQLSKSEQPVNFCYTIFMISFHIALLSIYNIFFPFNQDVYPIYAIFRINQTLQVSLDIIYYAFFCIQSNIFFK